MTTFYNKWFRRGILLACAFLACLSASAQGMKDMRINEVLVKNVHNYQDAYGQNIGWIELFNSGYSSVNIGGALLTVKVGDTNLSYRIPKNDERTLIPPQGFVIFFAEGTSTKGTFHTNFTLDQTGYIALFDQSGKGVPVSEIAYNIEDQKEDISIGYYTDDDGELRFGALDATTPLGPNDTEEKIPNHEKFRMGDPYGVKLAITSMSVVFVALLILYLIFRTIGKYNVYLAKRKEKEAEDVPVEVHKKEVINAEVIAAIALALKEWEEEMHDKESMVITINKVAKSYSPWNSKLYGLTQTPNKISK